MNMDNFDEETIVEKNNFKSKKIIVVLIVIILAGVFVFFYKNMAGLPTNSVINDEYRAAGALQEGQLLKVENRIFTTEEFEKFIYMYKIANEYENLEINSGEIEDLLYEFLAVKAYLYHANEHKIDFPSGELQIAKDYYSGEKVLFDKFGITEEEYIKYAKEDYKSLYLASHFSEYFDLPKGVIEELTNYFSGDDLKTYTYRLARFVYEEPETAEDVDYISKLDAETNARTALNLIKNGEDFQTAIDKHSHTSIIITPDLEYIRNGEVYSTIAPILDVKLGSIELAEAVKNLKSGECTDIFELTYEPYYAFVKLENVEEGFVGEGLEEVKEILLEEYESSMIYDVLQTNYNKEEFDKFVSKYE